MSEKAVVQNHPEVEKLVTDITNSLKNVQGKNLNYELDTSNVDMNAFDMFNDQIKNVYVPKVDKFESNLMQALITISKSVKEYEMMDKALSAIVTDSEITVQTKGTI